ncbi:hypothetical protein [Christiangramia echinicola]|uniref:Uncharacterized protein n=1 Tax=Christiangramia echinicola TaxID=279359 RepID=A0A1H1KW94_9FLAO|nr:hypothetical protein [Christiangramia echinicola]SDR66310.1 hypothetical protein SAMN04488552_0269 [Christiangramia echinicola]
MKKFYLLIILIITIKSNSQSVQKHTYLDNYNNKLTSEKFNELRTKNVTIQKTHKKDISIQKILYKQKVVELDSIQLNQIQQLLEKMTNNSFSETKNTMIHIFESNNEIYSESIENKRYWRWIKTNRKRIQAFLIGSRDSNIVTNSKKNTYVDGLDILKKIFFTDSRFKINHIYLEPNGTVKVFYGYDDILKILDYSV